MLPILSTIEWRTQDAILFPRACMEIGEGLGVCRWIPLVDRLRGTRDMEIENCIGQEETEAWQMSYSSAHEHISQAVELEDGNLF